MENSSAPPAAGQNYIEIDYRASAPPIVHPTPPTPQDPELSGPWWHLLLAPRTHVYLLTAISAVATLGYTFFEPPQRIALAVIVALFVWLLLALIVTDHQLQTERNNQRNMLATLRRTCEDRQREIEAQQRRYDRLTEHVRLIAEGAWAALTENVLVALRSGSPEQSATAVTYVLQEILDHLQRAFKDLQPDARFTAALLVPCVPDPATAAHRRPTHLRVALRSRDNFCHGDTPDCPITESVSGRVFHTKHSALVHDTHQPVPYPVRPFGDARSVMWVPVAPHNGVEFVLGVTSTQPHSLNSHHFDLLRGAGHFVATLTVLTDFKGNFQRLYEQTQPAPGSATAAPTTQAS